MNRRHVLMVTIALALGAAACDSGGSAGVLPVQTPVGRPTETDSLVIGLVGTLSGEEAWRGENAFEGADLAVHELNEAIGPGENPFEVVAFDDRGEPETAASRVAELTRLERTVGIIYAGPPEALPDAEEALASRGIPAVIVFGDLYSPDSLSGHIFQASPPYSWQAERLAAYLTRDRGYRRVGALVEDSFGGESALDGLRAALSSVPRTRLFPVHYPPGTRDFGPYLRELRGRRTDAVVFHGAPSPFASAVRGLGTMGAGYRSSRAARRGATGAGRWRPQLAAFDLVIAPRPGRGPRPGTMAAGSYARGAHYLPVPNFRAFDAAFREWWGSPPLGRQLRAYAAALALGWAAGEAEPGEDLAAVLERLRGVRFGGTEINLSPQDHVFENRSAVGLWTVPAPGARVPERARMEEEFPWVPLARGFSNDGRRTAIAPDDWAFLFHRPPPPNGPPPPARRMRFGVTSGPNDPVH